MIATETLPDDWRWTALLALDAESVPALEALAERLPAAHTVARALPTAAEACALARESLVTYFLHRRGPTSPAGQRLLAEGRAAGLAVLRLVADDTGEAAAPDAAEYSEDGALCPTAGTRLGDLVEAMGGAFELGIVGFDALEAARLLGLPGPVTAALTEGSGAEAASRVLEALGSSRLAAARRAFLSVEVHEAIRLPELNGVLDSLETALTDDADYVLSVPLVPGRQGLRVLVALAEGGQPEGGPTALAS